MRKTAQFGHGSVTCAMLPQGSGIPFPRYTARKYPGRAADLRDRGLGNSCFAVVMQAFIGDAGDDLVRVGTVRAQCRHQINAD